MSAFGISAGKITREKAGFVCESGAGLRIIRKTGGSADNAEFQHEIKEKLYEKGFERTDRSCFATDGRPYVAFNGEVYTMTAVTARKEADFSNPAEFAGIVEAVAKMHAAGRFDAAPANLRGGVGFLTEYRKNAAALSAIKKKIGRQARMSDFDVIFLKNCERFAALTKNSVKTLESAAEKRAKTPAGWHLCHHALKEETVRTEWGDVYVTDFSEASDDTQLFDLAAIIRRHFRYYGGGAFFGINIFQILEMYDKIIRIPHEDVETLRALLTYPHYFLKTIGRYYGKKRTWTPEALISRLRTAVAGQDAYESLIEKL